MIYKALDVREHYIVGKVDYTTPYGSSSTGQVHVPQHLRVVVIAEESRGTSKKRVRFEFLEAYQYEFLSKIRYGGYIGDWSMIIPGDYFIVEETDTQDRVTVINNL